MEDRIEFWAGEASKEEPEILESATVAEEVDLRENLACATCVGECKIY